MTLIDLADPASWPKSVQDLLNEALDEVRSAAYENGDQLRKWWGLEPLEKSVRSALSNDELLINHYTRLTDQDRDELQRNGMDPLERSAQKLRLKRACKLAGLTNQQTDDLIKSSPLEDPTQLSCRRGRIFGMALLQRVELGPGVCDTSGLWRFLTEYGGEATYGNADSQQPELSALRSISKPSIVQLAAPIANLSKWCDVGTTMLEISLRIRDENQQFSCEAPCKVVRILQPRDADWPC